MNRTVGLDMFPYSSSTLRLNGQVVPTDLKRLRHGFQDPGSPGVDGKVAQRSNCLTAAAQEPVDILADELAKAGTECSSRK